MLLVLLFLSGGDLYGQEQIILSSLDERELLTTLFETVGYSEETGGKWRPDVEERVNMQVSDDGFCYTKVDTVIGWRIDSINRYAAVVFATNSYYEGMLADCHACAPDLGVAVFQQNAPGWILLKFNKKLVRMGQWGVAGKSSLREIGPVNRALVLSSGFTNQGYIYGVSAWYDVSTWRDLPEISTVVDLDSGPDGCEEECDAEWCAYFHHVERSVQTIPNDDPETDYGGYDDLRVTVVERTCEGEETLTTERYRFNGFRYELICK